MIRPLRRVHAVTMILLAFALPLLLALAVSRREPVPVQRSLPDGRTR